MDSSKSDLDGLDGSPGDLPQDGRGKNMEDFRAGFVALVGDTNAGKSTLLNSLVGERIAITAAKPQTTRRRIQGIRTSDRAQFVFVDTPGFFKGHTRSELNRTLLREAYDAMSSVDSLVLVVDASRAAKDRGRFEALKRVFEERGMQPSLVVLNKVDLLVKEALLPQIAEVDRVFGGDSGSLPVIPISAKTGDGVKLLLEEIERLLPVSPPLFADDALTDQSEREIAEERIREQAIKFLQQELPYQIAVAVEQWKETERGLEISAAIYVARDNHKPMVIGKGGAMIKKIGTAARLELERFFGTHINLQLFVSVKKDWPQSRAGLHRVGIK